MPPNKNTGDVLADSNLLVISYLNLRQSIGCLGIALPFALAIGGLLIFQVGIQSTVSDYYYTGMRSVFVGILFAIGVFLFSYRGYQRKDNIAANLASFCAIGTALFPTPPQNATPLAETIGTLHIAFAVTFFVSLAYFSLVLFTKSDPTKRPTPRKLQRNTVYKACGYSIIGAIALSAIITLLPENIEASFQRFDTIFWLESIAIIAFGISWLTKGEAILKDRKQSETQFANALSAPRSNRQGR